MIVIMLTKIQNVSLRSAFSNGHGLSIKKP